MLPTVKALKSSAIASVLAISLALPATPALAWGQREQDVLKGVVGTLVIGALIKEATKPEPKVVYGTKSYYGNGYNNGYQPPRPAQTDIYSSAAALAFMRSRCSSSRFIPCAGSKRIVSIRSKPYPSTRAKSPFAKHSAHSAASLESATTPEPRPSETVFASSHKVKVRMATLNAASPFASIWPIDPQ